MSFKEIAVTAESVKMDVTLPAEMADGTFAEFELVAQGTKKAIVRSPADKEEYTVAVAALAGANVGDILHVNNLYYVVGIRGFKSTTAKRTGSSSSCERPAREC